MKKLVSAVIISLFTIFSAIAQENENGLIIVNIDPNPGARNSKSKTTGKSITKKQNNKSSLSGNKTEKKDEDSDTERSFHLSLEPLFGMKFGQVDEFVFLKKCSYSDDKLSELNWDIKNEFYLGAGIEAEIKKVFVDTSFTVGIPGSSGNMIDNDWQNILYSNCENKLYQTNYSKHDNEIESDYNFKIAAGYKFNPYKGEKLKFELAPFLGFEYSFISFSGKNGYMKYGYTEGKTVYTDNGPWHPYNEEGYYSYGTFSGEVITYQRSNYFVWLGLASTLKCYEKFSVNFAFQFSPYLYSESIDHHIYKKRYFGDITPGFFSAYRFNLGGEYKFSEKHSVCLNGSYIFTTQLRGNDYEKSDSEKTYKLSSAADGGAAEHYFDLSLSYKFKIF